MCFLFQHKISEAQILLLVIHRIFFSSVVVCFAPFFHITSVSQYRHIMGCLILDIKIILNHIVKMIT